MGDLTVSFHFSKAQATVTVDTKTKSLFVRIYCVYL